MQKRRSKLSENDQIELVIALFDRLTIPLAAAAAKMSIVGIVATLRGGDMAFGFIAAATVLSCAGRLFVIRLFHRAVEGSGPDIDTALAWRARYLRFNRLQASMVGLFVFHAFVPFVACCSGSRSTSASSSLRRSTSRVAIRWGEPTTR